MYSEVKDSGNRESFQTGAVRDTAEGKGRYDLLPSYAIQRLAQHYENGAKKYADENWRKGIPLRRFLDSGLRHAFKYLEGQRDEDHLAAAVWNFMSLIETEEMIRRGILPVSLNNLPDWSERDVEKIDEEEANREPTATAESTVYQLSRDKHPNDKSMWRLSSSGYVEYRYDCDEAWKMTPHKAEQLHQWLYNGTITPVDKDACGTTDGVNPLPPIPLLENLEGRYFRRYTARGLLYRVEQGNVEFQPSRFIWEDSSDYSDLTTFRNALADGKFIPVADAEVTLLSAETFTAKDFV